MDQKQKILENSGKIPQYSYLTEMAAAHLQKVINLLKQNKVKEAAAKYVEVGGSPVPSGLQKTINSYLKKNPNIDPKIFTNFRTEVIKAGKKAGIENKRKPTYKKQEVQTIQTKNSEGKIKKIKFKPGQDPAKRRIKILQIIDKQKGYIDAERRIISSGTEKEQRNLAKEIASDLTDENSSPKDQSDARQLQFFNRMGEGKKRSIEIMKDVLNNGEITLSNLRKMASASQMIEPDEKTIEKMRDIHNKIAVMKIQPDKLISKEKKRAADKKYRTRAKRDV